MPSYYQDVPVVAVEQEQPQIPALLTELEMSVTKLTEVTDMLLKRLEPLTTPIDPAPSAEKNRIRPLVPMAAHVADSVRGVHNIIDRVSSTIARLQV